MKKISSAGEIERLCKMREVQFYEVASRIDSAFELSKFDGGSNENAPNGPASKEKSYRARNDASWTLAFNLKTTKLIVRARVVVLKNYQRHVVDAGVVYDNSEPFEATYSAMLDFVGEY